MDKPAIEREARRLQSEIYSRRERRYEFGVPGIPTLFDPRNVADYCGLFYDERAQLNSDYPGGGEAAGLWRRDWNTILVSTRFPYEVQRFTAAHEIGHFVLHPAVGSGTMHRERPISGPHPNRSAIEREADYFAACLLMPRNAVIREFEKRFGTKRPVVLTETIAFHLRLDINPVFSAPRGSMLFAAAVARAQQFDRARFPSLASFFCVSPTAMAIRLEELHLVVPFLPS